MRTACLVVWVLAPALARADAPFVRVGGGLAWQRVTLHDDDRISGSDVGRAWMLEVGLGAMLTPNLALHGDYLWNRQRRTCSARECMDAQLTWQALGVGLTWYPGAWGGFVDGAVLVGNARHEDDGGFTVDSNLAVGLRALVGWELPVVDTLAVAAAARWSWIQPDGDDFVETRFHALGGLLFLTWRVR